MSNVFEDIYENINNTYGLKPMSIEDEINLPKYAKQTRLNKVKIIDTCKYAESLIETIRWRTRKAPELDDERHAALVQEMMDKVDEMYKAIETACRVGY